MKRSEKLRHRENRGFALIATISILVLLALISVGLLSLSTITVRSSQTNTAQAEARANARLALMLAIGQLQKAAGPDQRITATANVLDPNNSRAVTGVWEAYPLNPQAHPQLDNARDTLRDPNAPADNKADGEFVGWLTSEYAEGNFSLVVPNTESGQNSTTVLRASDTAGVTTKKDINTKVVEVKSIEDNDRVNGGLGWVTIDEGVKARFEIPNSSTAVASDLDYSRLGLRTTERLPAEKILPGLSGLNTTADNLGKIISYSQGSLAANDPEYESYFNDITTWSAGLVTDTAHGGLKQDLTLAFEADELPPVLQKAYLYSGDEDPLVSADPLFSYLRGHYQLYKREYSQGDPIVFNSNSLPPGFEASTSSGGRTATEFPVLNQLSEPLLAPIVTRVNVAFSLVGREAHQNWPTIISNKTQDPLRKYMVYLICTPVVTVHNPYTIPINFNELKVSFEYLPLAFKFFRNNIAQTRSPALLGQLHNATGTTTNVDDKFVATVVDANNNSRITLAPGEARVFGVANDTSSGWNSRFNYRFNQGQRSMTLDVRAREGWDPRSGFIMDWLLPQAASPTLDSPGLHVFGVRKTDQVNVEISLKSPTRNGKPLDHFNIKTTIKTGRSGQETVGFYRYEYGDIGRLTEAMQLGAHPTVKKVSYPVRRENSWSFETQLNEPNHGGSFTNWNNAQLFAMFNMAFRTSQDSLFPTKPGKNNSFVSSVLDMDITKKHPAQMPMEISFLPVIGSGTTGVGSFEIVDPGSDISNAYYFSGSTAGTGFPYLPVYSIPTDPIINIADLRHANLASSGHIPTPAYTVGESYASPMLAPEEVIFEDDELDYTLADHAWLANNSLWDTYYFSGIRNNSEFTSFHQSSANPVFPRMQPYIPVGDTVANLSGLIEKSQDTSGRESYTSHAGSHLLKGQFNINSTSEEAWTILLSSLDGTNSIPGLDLTDDNPETDYSVTAKHAPFPRMLDSASGSIDLSTNESQLRWTGFRQLSETERSALAKEIVAEVRTRGPFLSLSEFVNRRLDGPPQTLALRGAIEAAIDTSNLNSDSASGSREVKESDAEDNKFPYINAAIGDTEEGAAAHLSQGDILSVIGTAITPRSDTFVIRAYGESRNGSNQITARAYCEAVIQRFPEYVDPANSYDDDPGDNGNLLTDLNQVFGRKMKMISFRWLSPAEV